MFDGKIDFVDFNKIKINYGGKLTCRKLFKKKYILFLITSSILIIILAITLSIKNKNLKKITQELNEVNINEKQLEEYLQSISTKNTETSNDINKLQNDNLILNSELDSKRKEEETINKKNKEIIEQRNKLEKQSLSLSYQLKSESELKEVYEQKISSLNNFLSTLKIEYQKLIEQKGTEQTQNIRDSKIINSNEVSKIEKMIGASIINKCYDGVESNFDAKIFHNNCDGSPVLVLIKTDSNERIGAFTQLSFEGKQIINDPSSAIFNIDKGNYFTPVNSDIYTIVCDPDSLPQFGFDLKIKTNGKGVNSFPFNYGDSSSDEPEDLTKNENFDIKYLEIYKIEIYN